MFVCCVRAVYVFLSLDYFVQITIVYFYRILIIYYLRISVIMALFVCKCLNVTLESDKVEDNLDISKLELTSTEQRDNFFSEVGTVSKHLLTLTFMKGYCFELKLNRTNIMITCRNTVPIG